MEYRRCENCRLRGLDFQNYTRARECFKPKETSLLFVAEAPANRNWRDEWPYFYFANQRPRASSLYCNTMATIFKGEFNSNMGKEDYLRKFCSLGYYLLDAAKCPVDKMDLTDEEKCLTIESCAEANLLPEIYEMKPKAILLIKKSVFSVLRTVLADHGLPVLNDALLPFPGSGQQARYRVMLRMYLDRLQS